MNPMLTFLALGSSRSAHDSGGRGFTLGGGIRAWGQVRAMNTGLKGEEEIR